MVINARTRYIYGYMTGYILVLPIAVLALIPKMVIQHVKSAHGKAVTAYNNQHTEACVTLIVAEMADGTLRYVEDPFPSR